jgi:hypothetical protein
MPAKPAVAAVERFRNFRRSRVADISKPPYASVCMLFTFQLLICSPVSS